MFICLDVGSVICDVDFRNFIGELCANHQFNESDVWNFLKLVQPFHDMGLTRLSDELMVKYNISSETNPKIIEHWNQSITPNSISAHYLDELLNSGVKVAILSNMGYEHRQIIGNVIGPNLERCVQYFSCDVGTRKPYYLYYQSFLSQYPEYKNSIYIDDRIDNLMTGTKFGFDSVHMDTAKMNNDELVEIWQSVKTSLGLVI